MFNVRMRSPQKKTDTEGLQTGHPEKLIEYLEDRGKG